MSLANLSKAYSFMQTRVRMAEDQMGDFEELISQWFLDSNEGAREFLREIAEEHREKVHSQPVGVNSSKAT
jgi:hypothetical protein